MTAKRKTAAEKRAEAEAIWLEEQKLADDKFLKEYQTRLLTLVHSYVSELSLSIRSVGADEYRAFEFNTSRYHDVRLPVLAECDNRTVDQLREDMEEAEGFLEATREELRVQRERELRVQRERAEKKSAALSKLTKEERELLGL